MPILKDYIPRIATTQICSMDNSGFILNYSNFLPDEHVTMAEYVLKQLANSAVKKIEIKKFGADR